MRYFKNEPTKLTLGTHSYTPTKDTFFKSSNRESYGVSRKHNYIPHTPSSSSTNKSSRYLDNIERKHNYVPTIGNNSHKNKCNHEARNITIIKNNISFQSSSFVPAESSPKVDNDMEMESALFKDREEQERQEKERLERTRQEETLRQKDQQERENKKRDRQDEAARKLQAFLRGSMCRARVSIMLLQLIEGLLAEKKMRQSHLEEEKERELEKEDASETSRSQQYVFAALEAFEDDHQFVLQDESNVNFALEHQTTSILKSPERKTKYLTTDVRSICFVDSKNQVREIERAMEYAQLPEWWMEYAPHGTLQEDEIDDRFTIVPPSHWVHEEEKEGDVLVACTPGMNLTRDAPMLDEDFEIVEEEFPMVDDEESTEQANHEKVHDAGQAIEEEIAHEEVSMVEEEATEEEELDQTCQSTTSTHEQESALSRPVQSPSLSTPRTHVVVSSPTAYKKLKQPDTLDTADPLTMSLAERMKYFQKDSHAPVKKNFRATTFR
jgi:hypothetical protein